MQSIPHSPAIQEANQRKLRKIQVRINIGLQCNMQSRPHSPAIQEANQLELGKNQVQTNKLLLGLQWNMQSRPHSMQYKRIIN
jgi:hypothetical protein